MPRFEDDDVGAAPKKPRPPMRFSKPFIIAETPEGYELRDASGIVMAKVPATAFPDAFPLALSVEDAKRVAVRLREKMNAEDPKPAPEETRPPERDQRDYGGQQGSTSRGGGNGARGSRGRASGPSGQVQDSGSRRQQRQGIQR